MEHQESTSVISIVEDIITKAVKQRASDIHFEPMQQGLRVRFRIDGVLFDQPLLPHELMGQIISRLKVLGQINIAERRIAQDGKFTMSIDGAQIDLRVATFPCLYGQKVVVRILDRAGHMISLASLGFQSEMLSQLEVIIRRSNGFFLVTGPTGSGKTTTLYAILMALNSFEKNIVTLEDPVEYNLDGITQGQIHPEAGFTFDQGVRSVLRQDPDIIMVGEIRDKQTAHVAIEAALTGHLVLSTLHTNDSPGAIMRLMDMGIEPFLITASLSGVLAQRLARKICPECKVAIKPTGYQQNLMKQWDMHIDELFYGRGCATCEGLGLKGRIGIFELLLISNELRMLIIKQPIFQDIYEQARRDGIQFLIRDAAAKVKAGIITLDEMIRIVL